MVGRILALLIVLAGSFGAGAVADDITPAEQIARELGLVPTGDSGARTRDLGAVTGDSEANPRGIQFDETGQVIGLPTPEQLDDPRRPRVDLATITFEFNSTALTAQAKRQLDEVAKALNLAQGIRFMVGGHTDSVGSDAYNQALSEQRARAVVSYLVTHGDIRVEALLAMGWGESRPADPANPTSAVNRRVEIANLGRAN